jgi:hypothetical protein
MIDCWSCLNNTGNETPTEHPYRCDINDKNIESYNTYHRAPIWCPRRDKCQ